MLGIVLMFGFFLAVPDILANVCIPKDFGEDSIVCVCNATYCDSTPNQILEDGHFHWYTTSKSGLRLNYVNGIFSTQEIRETILLVNSRVPYQSIIGWGGAFTDSSGINIKQLSLGSQDKLMRSYFGEEGCKYNLGRIPIGASDFSLRAYTYDDYTNDTELKNFSLTDEELNYKIPFIKQAQIINPNIQFIGAAWTAPPWMKTNNDYIGRGLLLDQYYQTFADYFIKFLEAYERYGIKFWSLSTGNSPNNAFHVHSSIISLGWTPKTVGKWIVNNFGPTLANSKYNDVIIMTFDDKRSLLPKFVDQLFQLFPEAQRYVKGIAMHWYLDWQTPATILDVTHQHNADKFLLMTESCLGYNQSEYPGVRLGLWDRGEKLAVDMIDNFNHWMNGWVDWNLALDEDGGPTWGANKIDASIIVNTEKDEFYHQPMYYAMKHFSRFIPPGSIKIQIDGGTPVNVSSTAFITPNQEIVIVLYNRYDQPTNVTIRDLNKPQVIINLQLAVSSIHTIIYK